MFENRLNSFSPNMGLPQFSPGVFPQMQSPQDAARAAMAIQLDEIYKAAVQRSKEEHEIDKLFNAEFYNDYEI